MNDMETDFALQRTERRLEALSRQVTPDPFHKAHLRRQLLTRHREIAAQKQRSPLRSWSWPRISPLKRLTLTLPPLGAALVASVVLFVVPILSGHQTLQAAEAQRLSPALMYNVPRITSWQWTVRETIGQHTRVQRWQATLTPLQRVYVKYGQVYFYDNRDWLQPASNLTGLHTTAYDWQWAFGLLPGTLASSDFGLLPVTVVDGRRVEGIKKTIAISGERAVTLTFWVRRPTGLVLRLERDVTAGNRELEHDVVDYRYQRTT